MKAYYLSLLFLCIAIGGAMLNLTDLLDVTTEYDSESIDTLTGSYDGLQPYSKPLDDEVEFQTEDPNLIDRAIGLWNVITTVLFPHVFLRKVIGIDPALANLCSVPIYMIHMIALAQLFGALKAGRSAI